MFFFFFLSKESKALYVPFFVAEAPQGWVFVSFVNQSICPEVLGQCRIDAH